MGGRSVLVCVFEGSSYEVGWVIADIGGRSRMLLSDKQRLPLVKVIERSLLFSAVVMRDRS
jgi:hypothetical protein